MSEKRKKRITVLGIIIIILAVIALFSILITFVYYKKNIDPAVDEMLFNSVKGGSITEYYYNASSDKDEYIPQLYEISKTTENKKLWYSLDDIAPILKDGFIAVEDKDFYKHNGVNIRRTGAALLNSLLHFNKTFGASTITQQVIKNISGDNQLSIKRKFNEILRAISLEKNHTKDEILEVYVNLVPMGENMFGVGVASKEYFGKEPSELSASEAATIIGIINAPTRYNPHENPEECLRKRNDILFVFHEENLISDKEYQDALNNGLNVLPKNKIEKQVNSWFVETVEKDVADSLVSEMGVSREFAEHLIRSGGLKIYTTVDPTVQARLEEYFSNLENFPSGISSGMEFSMVISDSQNGDLVGIVGAVGDKNANRLLNHALVPHTPGSSIKPLALYAPLIDMKVINYATVFDDVPLSFSKVGANFIEYPKNYPEIYDGLTTVKDALVKSKNTVALRLFNLLGAENIYRNLKQNFRFNTLIRGEHKENGDILTDVAPSPLGLGQLTYGVSLRALTEAYTVFPSEGTLGNSRSFVAVYDNRGELILENKKQENRIFRKESSRIMNLLLSNVTESGTARSVTLKNLVDTAGKTGTSGDDKDRLFIGYTPYYTAGIWCGYTEGSRSIGKISKTHLKIWDEVMTSIHQEKLSNVRDEEIKSFSIRGLKRVAYCKDSGKLFSSECSYDPRGDRIEYGYFEEGNLPSGFCDRHVLCYYDELTDGVATEFCPSENLKLISLLKINDRNFKKEIYISDADYVFMEMDEEAPLGDNYDIPYYFYMLEDGEFIGRGRRKKQFNSSCYIHSE